MSNRKGLAVRRGRLAPDSPAAVARDLGWFSLGLGLAELLQPRAVAHLTGMRWTAPVLTLFGLREVATGVGLLTSDDPQPWVWGRVAGDALDLGLVGLGVLGASRSRGRATLALLALAGVTAVDVLCAQTLDERSRRPRRRFDYGDRSGLPQMTRGAAKQAAPAAAGR